MNKFTLPLSTVKSTQFRYQSLTALLLGLLCFIVYNTNLRQIGSGDTLPARYLPLILLSNGTLNLGTNAHLVAQGHSMLSSSNRPVGAVGQILYNEPEAYWITRTVQHQLASMYPVVTPLLVSPLYLPAVLWLNAQGWQQPQLGWMALIMEKFSASFLASLTCVLMYLLLRRDGNRWSLPLALVFAFGTNTWMISSQALWQHGTGEFLITLALLLVLVRASPIRTALLGAVCVLMAANRPPDGLIAGAIVLFVFWNRRRSALWLLVGAAVPLAAFLYYNLIFMGNFAGGYGIVKIPQGFFQPVWSGLAGLLVSPTRGLLVFTPFFIFIFVGLRQRLRSPGSKGLALALSFAVSAQILLYSLGDWRAGVSWGPRWLTDILPILVWMLAPAPLILRPLARGLLVVSMVASVVVQSIGAFWYTYASDIPIFAGNPASMSAAWDVGNIPFITELRHPPAPAELQCRTFGSIDHIGTTSQPAATPTFLESGAMLKGWSLTCNRTPAQVVLLIDGIVIGKTSNFLSRVDVNTMIHNASPSGWRVPVNTLGVSPGDRVLQLAVRINPGSQLRIVRELHVIVIAPVQTVNTAQLPQKQVLAPMLEAMAKRAAQLVRTRQTKPGYWLTTFTNKLRYEAPQQEMNTFLTSMMVDMLTPVARQQGLDDVVITARQHLASQIENTGLVRFHGLPNSPTIGTMGCVITPDSDDTALVWRIVDPLAADPRRQLMLAELARYQDSRGLYRTWLAPQTQYQCINPGKDPNPTDIGIQMHVYMMLRKFDAPAGLKLCDALKRSFWDEDIWVYYSQAPLVPYLRSAELRQLGCAIPMPTEQLALHASGQDLWSEAVRLFAETIRSAPDEQTRLAIRNLLARIGSDDFKRLRSSPPLLYNNDMSASVKRFYWSEDFGYALWLRLYETAGTENLTIQQPSP